MSRNKQKIINLYSVYDKKTDLPIIIDGTAKQCAEVMDVEYTSFYKIYNRAKNGLGEKWEIFQTGGRKARKGTDIMEGISKLNIEMLTSFIRNGRSAMRTAKKEFMTVENVYFHLNKFKDKFGLNPRVESELQQIIEKLGDKIAV